MIFKKSGSDSQKEELRKAETERTKCLYKVVWMHWWKLLQVESHGYFWDACRKPVNSSLVLKWTTGRVSNQLNIADCSGRSTLTVKNSQGSTRLRNMKLTDLEEVKVCKQQMAIITLFTNDALLWVPVDNKQSSCS